MGVMVKANVEAEQKMSGTPHAFKNNPTSTEWHSQKRLSTVYLV